MKKNSFIVWYLNDHFKVCWFLIKRGNFFFILKLLQMNWLIVYLFWRFNSPDENILKIKKINNHLEHTTKFSMQEVWIIILRIDCIARTNENEKQINPLIRIRISATIMTVSPYFYWSLIQIIKKTKNPIHKDKTIRGTMR